MNGPMILHERNGEGQTVWSISVSEIEGLMHIDADDHPEPETIKTVIASKSGLRLQSEIPIDEIRKEIGWYEPCP